MAKLGPIFKTESSKVASLIVKTDPNEVTHQIKKYGFININGYKIIPEYVYIKKKKIMEYGKHFIPHVVEEVWKNLGNKKSVFLENGRSSILS